jgi:hypothetical protein
MKNGLLSEFGDHFVSNLNSAGDLNKKEFNYSRLISIFQSTDKVLFDLLIVLSQADDLVFLGGRYCFGRL